MGGNVIKHFLPIEDKFAMLINRDFLHPMETVLRVPGNPRGVNWRNV